MSLAEAVERILAPIWPDVVLAYDHYRKGSC